MTGFNHEITDDEIVSVAERLMLKAILTRGVRTRPWSDNLYGRASTVLRYALPKEHPFHPYKHPADWSQRRLAALWKKYFPDEDPKAAAKK